MKQKLKKLKKIDDVLFTLSFLSGYILFSTILMCVKSNGVEYDKPLAFKCAIISGISMLILLVARAVIRFISQVIREGEM